MSQESKPIKVLRQEKPKQPLRNLFELIKVMRAHRIPPGPLSGDVHGGHLENQKTTTAEPSGRSDKRLVETLFPRLYMPRGKKPPVASNRLSEESSRTLGSDQTEGEHIFLENGYCITHKRFCRRGE